MREKDIKNGKQICKELKKKLYYQKEKKDKEKRKE